MRNNLSILLEYTNKEMFTRIVGLMTELDALNMLLGKYQSQNRLEEAVRVQTILKREQDKTEYYGHGFQQDM
ncbi:MAG TPA: hypothetical protein VE548_03755 [Nitrososphaeraceae archaeon]|nr:hypothetical protein [Nitrososphaeraceae archaeon]